MNLTLSKRGDYVVRSALSLARAYPGTGYRKIREVVAEMGVPQTFASQILKDLARAGLAESRAGKDGGYRLARPPREISLLAVVEAGEGPLRSDRCGLGDGPCRWDLVCPLHDTWTRATSAMRAVLAQSTLADLLATDLAIEEGAYVRPRDSHRTSARTHAFDDWVQVERGFEAVSSQLQRDAWLVPLLEDAFNEVDALRERLDPLSPHWSASRVDVSIAPGIDRSEDRPATKGGEGEIDLAWEASTLDGLYCHGDARLTPVALDDERTELRATGRLRPPLAQGADPQTDDARRQLEKRLTDAFVRATLRRMAKVLEAEAIVL